MRSYRIYLFRHGKTAANAEGRYIGQTDEPLSENGMAELLMLKKEAEYPPVGKVYASPLQRCLQSAYLFYPDHTIFTVDGLKEYHFGEYENQKLGELSQNNSFFQWISQGGAETPKGAETTEDFTRRIFQAFDEIIKDMMKNRISDAAVVTHGGVIMSLLAMCGLPRVEPANWALENGHGYSLLVNAQLWGNTASFEICDRLPYREQEEFELKNFDLMDVDEMKRELHER